VIENLLYMYVYEISPCWYVINGSHGNEGSSPARQVACATITLSD